MKTIFIEETAEGIVVKIGKDDITENTFKTLLSALHSKRIGTLYWSEEPTKSHYVFCIKDCTIAVQKVAYCIYDIVSGLEDVPSTIGVDYGSSTSKVFPGVTVQPEKEDSKFDMLKLFPGIKAPQPNVQDLFSEKKMPPLGIASEANLKEQEYEEYEQAVEDAIYSLKVDILKAEAILACGGKVENTPMILGYALDYLCKIHGYTDND